MGASFLSAVIADRDVADLVVFVGEDELERRVVGLLLVPDKSSARVVIANNAASTSHGWSLNAIWSTLWMDSRYRTGAANGPKRQGDSSNSE